MFELEEYSSGFHDGFLNKYAVSLEKKPNLFYLCFCFNCLCRRPSVRFLLTPTANHCVLDRHWFAGFFRFLFYYFAKKEDEQEIHVCMYSKNIYTCVWGFLLVFFTFIYRKRRRKLSRILNSVTARPLYFSRLFTYSPPFNLFHFKLSFSLFFVEYKQERARTNLEKRVSLLFFCIYCSKRSKFELLPAVVVFGLHIFIWISSVSSCVFEEQWIIQTTTTTIP